MDEYRRYERPVRITDGIHWVGGYQDRTLQCNPFLVQHAGRGVLIDPGSRGDFSTVMMKTMQAGIDPRQISALIYQHYDPDLCGSMANLIETIANPDLRVLTTRGNRAFLSFYVPPRYENIFTEFDPETFVYDLAGRELHFVATPYCHAQGSFVTYDPTSRTLFSSDLFGSFSRATTLYEEFSPECASCTDWQRCPNGRTCPLPGIVEFHRRVMPCNKALRLAMRRLRDLDLERIAPQHGFVISRRADVELLIEQLERLDRVGIDAWTD